MALPLISVVLSSFNGEKFIQQQIDSILAQTYTNLEIILADDCSTDRTRQIISAYGSFKNVKIIFRENNVGFSQNFYETALLAKGAYIAFSDQDDIWLPHKIEHMYNAIEDHYLAYGNSSFIDDSGNLTGRKLSDIRKMGDVKNTKGFFLENVAWGHTLLIKKKILEYYFPLPENVAYDKWLAVLATCLSGIKYVDEPLNLYRQHDATVTQILLDTKTDMPKQSLKYDVFMRTLNWLKVLKNNVLEKDKIFYNRFYNLYAKKIKGKFCWQLFFFMVKNQKEIFSFRQKSYLSNILEIRKISRGVKKL